MFSFVKRCGVLMPKVSKFSFSTKKKLTSVDFRVLKKKGDKIAMVTAYDYPTAMHAENAEFDMILVGDSLGMVILGHETTQSVTMDEMIHHCKAVRRGAPNTFIIGDMPFGSYEVNNDDAVRNAFRFLKESQMDAVKLEGARPETVHKLVSSGVAVMGHIGLTPQGISVLGGFRAQGRTASKAYQIIQDAIKLEEAGAFALVVECVPSIVAKAVQDAVSIPVIGIGAGPDTAGQVLVYHDLLGIIHHPHHEKHVPSFCKRYAKFGPEIHKALVEYQQEVKAGTFPDESFSPYKMSEQEQHKFKELLRTTGHNDTSATTAGGGSQDASSGTSSTGTDNSNNKLEKNGVENLEQKYTKEKDKIYDNWLDEITKVY